MTKIPMRLSSDRLILTAFVRGRRFGGKIEFIVDTGSPDSFIGSEDAIKLNIPIVGKLVRAVKIGGSSIGLHDLGEVGIKVEDENGQLITLNQPNFLGSRDMAASRLPCPSLLGIEFLRQNKFALYFAPSIGVAYLEKLDL